MKYIIILTLSFFIYTNALYAEQNHIQCQNFYSKQEYNQTLQCLHNNPQNYNNLQFQLLWAKTEEKLGRINYEIAAYERILMLDPINLNAIYTLTSLYMKNKQKQNAILLLNQVDTTNLTSQKKREFQQFKNEILKQKKFPLAINFQSQIGYDSNIASSKNAEATLFLQNKLGINSKKLFFNNSKNFSLQMNTTLLHQYNFEHTLYNIFSFKGGATLHYKYNTLNFFLPISYEHTYYLKKDFIASSSISPTLSYRFIPNTLISTTLVLKSNKYIASNMKNYDSLQSTLAQSFFYFQKQNYISLKLFYTYAKAMKNSIFTSPRYIDFHKYTTSIEAFYTFNKTLSFQTIYSLNYTDYKENREDTYNNIAFILKHKLSQHFAYKLSFSYGVNETDYNLAKINKSIASIALQYKY